ncbi:MAG TPA: response regulator [Pirellulales bacterium]|nr:response regulator [Pirellulales bacterium]
MTTTTPTGPLAARVLVVEDHPDTADFLSRYARLLGCEVRTACTGAQALETALEFLPQIVLLDIGLPDMDGWEFARCLRRELEPVHPVLIAITAFRSQDDRIRSLEAGIDYHLNKPAFREELMRLLLELVGRT